MRRRVFGVTVDAGPPALRERIVAGLRLYVATADLLADAWTPEAAPLIGETGHLVQATLGPDQVLPS